MARQITAPSADTMGEPFIEAMRRLAGGVCVVTVADEDDCWHGMTATSVTSVSMAPPSLLVCINRENTIFGPIDRRQSFCINILAQEHQDHSTRFSSPSQRETRFEFGEWRLHADLPYLGDAQAAIFCDVAKRVIHGSHAVLIGNVKDIIVPVAIDAPLVYFNRQYLAHAAAGHAA